ncbi:Uncharacterized protein LHYA1_G008106 [Lachnellula hyalina]|uniref:Uncharacterized protein n=1 Tax=Lachnellula hyalina TaxID=1316788 RepID=A0A8H8QWQ4_9HELO|nr:Uncharacterized protein LHYA1_G008106 [Lachnellula hyalina]TVY23115.1 Uncharacterized protein LHYA1_G008106 [Lachnellula hyalina]
MSEITGIPPPDTSPSSSISIPTPSPPKPPPIPSIQTLKSWAPLYLSKTDRTITHLNKILSTPSGTDSFLCTLRYTTLLSSVLLSSISISRIHKQALALIETAISLPPNTTVIIDTSSIPSSRLLVTAQRLKALSSLISDFRIFARLWGLLGLWAWGKSVWLEPSKDKVLARIAYAQVFVNVCYQYLENGAYLSSKGALGWNGEKQGRAWVWSSRFWMAHTVLDLGKLYHEWQVRRGKSGKGDEEVEEKSEEAWRRLWKKQLVVDLAYAPLTVHYSLENGLMGDFLVALSGSVAGLTGFRYLWRNTSS